MNHNIRASLSVVAAAAALLLAGCERPPVQTVQVGYRGVAMEQVNNPRLAAKREAANVVPAALPAAPSDPPMAKDVYQNIQVLDDLSLAEFTRLMLAMTAWVSPEQGCTYCHAEENLADDSKYTKVVSRQMLRMTRHINSNWTNHVAQTGVTCYTCHRGQNVPANIWYSNPGPRQAAGMARTRVPQNVAEPSVGLSSLPYDPFNTFLRADPEEIKVISKTALPAGSDRNIKQTEYTYGLMIHMSESLGVNCTHCHNTRSMAEWDQSTPQRATAWYGIRMVRDVNVGHIEPLQGVFPPNRLGPLGDVPKVNCATCHQGVNKPLYGVSMVKDYPELRGARVMAAAPADPAPADPSAAAAPAEPVPAAAAGS
ncbi:MAG: photosynthetic reaction center cytochrome PufC [Steroidobacteraceae bacterium]|nr:photosynthetic reaction center cytochrome PufC [Steroidobacteraceae bacterium]